MKETIINIEDLKQDDFNFNLGSEVGKELLEKSFRELGAGRSVLVDKDNRLIGGNKAQQAAIAAGIKKVRVIDTDGTELVAVRRTDVTLDSKQGRDLALADNITAEKNLSWDVETMERAAEEFGMSLEDWGVDFAGHQIDIDQFFEDAAQSKKTNEVKIEIILPEKYEEMRNEIKDLIVNTLKDFENVVVK